MPEINKNDFADFLDDRIKGLLDALESMGFFYKKVLSNIRTGIYERTLSEPKFIIRSIRSLNKFTVEVLEYVESRELEKDVHCRENSEREN